jgi:pilus assembly protein FimV
MNGMSKLSLAIALALTGGNAFALGLGAIQVHSGLNQPLDAEIPVTTESAAEANGLIVSMASAADFERVGLSRARVTVPIDFAVSTNSRGQAVIKLTTKDIVREPFLDFLVEVNWPKGKLLREYTALLDPPVMAPAVHGSSATVAPAKEVTAAPAQKLAEEKQPKPKPATVKPPRTATAEPKAAPAPKPAPAPKAPAPAATTRTAAAGDYGPVAQGETLSEVARATKPDDSTNVNQMMLALLKNNPNAFYKDNINALKRGAILRIPTSDELKATGSASAAAAAVREQNEAWSGNAAVAKPTVIASAGAPKNPAPAKVDTKPAAKSNEHLALVPPRAGKDSQATADHPGPATGTGSSADSKAELARTKENLASREQEATELKSRVKQLEDLNGKDQRLLSLKESEIADLQNKLKELQSGKTAATTPAPVTATPKPAETPAVTSKPTDTKPADTTKPAETAAAKSDAKITAQDIWGSIANEKNPAAKPGTTAPTTAAPTTVATTPPASTTTPPAASSTTPGATPSATPPATPASTNPSTTAATTPPATTSSTISPSATSPSPTSATSTTTPSTTAPSSTSATTPVTTAPTSTPSTLSSTPPVTTPPVKPATPPAPKPVVVPPASEPAWYENNTVLLGGGIGLLLIGALALMRFMRKPKPLLDPMPADDDLEHHLTTETSEGEHHLLDALAQNPGDPHLSLELLNLYYAHREAAKFEAAAEAMYAHIADPTQPEWQQVRAMGEELCPHNPLFGGSDLGGGGYAQSDEEHTVFGQFDTGAHAHEESFDLGTAAAHHDVTPAAAEEHFDFDLTDHAAAAAPVNDMDFAHEPPVSHPTPPPPVAVAAKPAEDFFAGEDAIGTKLDLAKAYLDMGDPEGARSMLDEVMAEGNDTQKGEARKLLAEIR